MLGLAAQGLIGVMFPQLGHHITLYAPNWSMKMAHTARPNRHRRHPKPPLSADLPPQQLFAQLIIMRPQKSHFLLHEYKITSSPKMMFLKMFARRANSIARKKGSSILSMISRMMDTRLLAKASSSTIMLCDLKSRKMKFCQFSLVMLWPQ